VYKSFTDIAQILKNHNNPKTLKLLRVSFFVPEIRNLKSQLVIVVGLEEIGSSL